MATRRKSSRQLDAEIDAELAKDDDDVDDVARRAFHERTAKAILAFVADAPSALPHGRKVYIADVAAHFGTTARAMTPVLARLRRMGLVRLSRADLVAAYDARKLAASHVDLGGAEVHFVDKP